MADWIEVHLGEKPGDAKIEVVDEKEEGKEPAPEPKQEPAPEQEEKKEDGTRAQKRIRQLVREKRQAEEAALKYQQDLDNVRKEIAAVREKAEAGSKAVVNNEGETLKAQAAAVQQAWRKAREDGDLDAEFEAQQRWSELNNRWASLQHRKAEPAPPPPPPPPAAAPTGLHPKAQAWIDDNSDWWEKPQHRRKTHLAMAIAQELVDEGFDQTDDVYYTELDKRLSSGDKPDTSTQARTRQVVAAGSRAQRSNGNKIVLSREEQDIAKRLGVSLEDYARNLRDAEEAEKSNQGNPGAPYLDVDITRRSA